MQLSSPLVRSVQPGVKCKNLEDEQEFSIKKFVGELRYETPIANPMKRGGAGISERPGSRPKLTSVMHNLRLPLWDLPERLYFVTSRAQVVSEIARMSEMQDTLDVSATTSQLHQLTDLPNR